MGCGRRCMENTKRSQEDSLSKRSEQKKKRFEASIYCQFHEMILRSNTPTLNCFQYWKALLFEVTILLLQKRYQAIKLRPTHVLTAVLHVNHFPYEFFTPRPFCFLFFISEQLKNCTKSQQNKNYRKNSEKIQTMNLVSVEHIQKSVRIFQNEYLYQSLHST